MEILPVYESNWQEKLPAPLLQNLKACAPKKISRRRLIYTFLGTSLITGGLFALHRCMCYDELSGWQGKVLSSHQALILMKAGEIILPPVSSQELRQVLKNIDNYLFSLPVKLIQEIELMLSVAEHSTAMKLYVQPFTQLNLKQRGDYLANLNRSEGKLYLCYRGIRDLCMLGFYQTENARQKIAYPGPLLGDSKLPCRPEYVALKAIKGQSPKTIIASGKPK